jgi:glycosyltransferase involved in cell wall biosynthesis
MYNEAPVVATVVSDLRSAFLRVVCVDDGSSDGSAEVAELAGATVVPAVAHSSMSSTERAGRSARSRTGSRRWSSRPVAAFAHSRARP